MGKTEKGTTDCATLPSRFQIGDRVCVAGAQSGAVAGVSFDEAKVRYDVDIGEGQCITYVDSCLVEPAR